MKAKREILAELDRELALRKRVYPRWVSVGRLTVADMEHRIACLEAARDELQKLWFGKQEGLRL